MKIDDYRDSELVKKITRLISKTIPSRKIKIMHVCGTHENFIGRFGLRSLLPENIELVAGPGCPVCVCPASDINTAIEIASMDNVILATFGDMIRVPSRISSENNENDSLQTAKSRGADVRIIYSPLDAQKIAEKNPDKRVVFFSVGFETTAAGVASLIYNNPPDNFSILSSHRLIPPSMELLLGIGDIQIDGFLLPGHVTTVIGMKPFEIFPEAYLMPTVSAGFEPLDILSAVLNIVEQIKEGKASLTNKYTRAVKEDGNPKAIKIMSDVFEEVSSYWRGIGRIPRSGLKLRDKYSKWDANKIFDIEKGDKDFFDIHPHCSCHLIMIGKIYPPDCPLFAKKACNPENPFGPCMVSMDGTCRIWYRYGQKTVGSMQ
ncbi:MAG: hydrogenase formation protein HypD [Nitrospinae bacterium RIFCSPLOWO2_01_FULL_39_10]|nr:MAG: hydrogenase formation protein HypD [Nitrospinae bacterium RIFCSPLOWO2_01_FULL_39_10]